MTKKDALKSVINFPLPDNTLEKALIDAGVAGGDTYASTDSKVIDLCAAGLLLFLITSSDIKEGDVSRTLPSEGKLKTAYSMLVGKWGEPNLLTSGGEPTITGLRPW